MKITLTTRREDHKKLNPSISLKETFPDFLSIEVLVENLGEKKLYFSKIPLYPNKFKDESKIPRRGICQVLDRVLKDFDVYVIESNIVY